MKNLNTFLRSTSDLTSWLHRETLNFVYPPFCCSCNCPILYDSILCAQCLADIEYVDPFELDTEMGPLQSIDAVFSMWMFQRYGPISKLHQRLKYGNHPSTGVTLGRMLGRYYADAHEYRPSEDVPLKLVIPVPLHRLRYLDRGYNQAERLAAGFCELTGLGISTDYVSRTKMTVSQTGLSVTQRQENVMDVFKVNNNQREVAESVLVMDDVLTTGATVESLARVLKKSGVKTVEVVSLAFTQSG